MGPGNPMRYTAPALLTPHGWVTHARLDIDDTGTIVDIREDPTQVGRRLPGFVIPGLPNVHSHTFQRAMAGRAERRASSAPDSFWTWREEMYRWADRLELDDLRAIARWAFIEMLEAGMTAVAEFHYVHHRRDGGRSVPAGETAHAVAEAATQSGIRLTLLPALYLTGGFGRAAGARQRRFVHRDVDDFFRTWQSVKDGLTGSALEVGFAAHSLRAVPPAALQDAVTFLTQNAPDSPIHIHIAEQSREVVEAVNHLGTRPVRWLLDHHDVGERWCLVHATHVNEDEVIDLAASGAVAGLCPTTEANLGDGIFPARMFLHRGGAFAVGTDSHALISSTEELRLLECVQRLTTGQRNVLAKRQTPSVGHALWEEAVRGGMQALSGEPAGLTPGARADFVVLDPSHARLRGHSHHTVLDAFVFGGADSAVLEVYVGGRRTVAEGRHVEREWALREFASCVQRLRSAR